MFLCMDEYGNVYQAASHRADGRGVEKLPSVVSESRDNTLDNSFKKNDAKIQSEHKQLKALNASSDAHQMAMHRKRSNHAKYMAMMNHAKTEAMISKPNQKAMYNQAMDKKMGQADFDRLSIVDANYNSKHMAALQYQNEKMGTKPSEVDMSFSTQVMPESGKTSKELMLEMEANGLREKTALTKEFAEYQTIPQTKTSVNLSDDALVRTTSEAVAQENMVQEEKKKSKLPLVAGGLALAYLLLG